MSCWSQPDAVDGWGGGVCGAWCCLRRGTVAKPVVALAVVNENFLSPQLLKVGQETVMQPVAISGPRAGAKRWGGGGGFIGGCGGEDGVSGGDAGVGYEFGYGLGD